MVMEESYVSRAYRDIAILLDTHKKLLNKSMKFFYLYDKNAVLERISQVVCLELTDNFLLKILSKDNKNNEYQYSPKLVNFQCGRLNIYPKQGQIKPSNTLVASCVRNFLVFWCYILYCFFISIFSKRNNHSSAVLMHGVPVANLLSEEGKLFEEFCVGCNINFLMRAKKYIVQVNSRTKMMDKKNFTYVRYPLLTLLSNNRYSISEGIQFFHDHVKILFGFIFLVFKNPILCLLWRDYALHSSAKLLNEKELIEANLITNSNWLMQYLWMSDLPGKKFKTYLALYSINSEALRYIKAPKPANHPGLRLLRVDYILSWGAYYERVLRDEHIYASVLNVGPILWTLKESKSEKQIKDNSKFKVCIFGVSPKRNKDLKKMDTFENYYNLENCKLFISETISAINSIDSALRVKLEIQIKHKRKKSDLEDDLYFKYVDELVHASNNIKLLPEESNLWSMIANCDLVIAIPYTSPAYIAEYLGINAVFFDASGLLMNGIYQGAKINFSRNKNELINIISKHVIDHNKFMLCGET
jgi:polysaccharide biosynthesis PFTS motif protein